MKENRSQTIKDERDFIDNLGSYRKKYPNDPLDYTKRIEGYLEGLEKRQDGASWIKEAKKYAKRKLAIERKHEEG